MRGAVEAGCNQRAVMGGQAVCICECVRAHEPHCGQSSVTDRHEIPLPSECVALSLCTVLCVSCILRWLNGFSPADLLGASTTGVSVPTSEQRGMTFASNLGSQFYIITFPRNN